MKKFKISLNVISAITAVMLLSSNIVTINTHAQATTELGQFNYGYANQLSLLFYDAQRSGSGVDNRFDWRGDAFVGDGSDVGVDLSGGYHDAGDHIKFGYPLANAMTNLAWGGIEFEEEYNQIGTYDDLKEAVRWGTDWMLKAHIHDGTSTQELYVQVGLPEFDHSMLGAPETATMPRPSQKITPLAPGTDVAMAYAASLAMASQLFADDDPQYSARLWSEAKMLYEFGDTYRGVYADSINTGGPYQMRWSDERDEIHFAQAVFAKVSQGTPEFQTWFDLANRNVLGFDIIHGGGNQNGLTEFILAQINGDFPGMRGVIDRFIGQNVTTPDGMIFEHEWASLTKGPAAVAFLAGIYEKESGDTSLRALAADQIDYILGDNPLDTSYIVGFGDTYPLRVHHRAASGINEWSTWRSDTVNENIIFGALVGGPGSADDFDYQDDRTDFQRNEVAIGYNSQLAGALAYMYGIFGGQALSDQELAQLPGVLGQFQVDPITVEPMPEPVTAEPQTIPQTGGDNNISQVDVVEQDTQNNTPANITIRSGGVSLIQILPISLLGLVFIAIGITSKLEKIFNK